LSNPISGVKRFFGGYSNKGNGLLNNKGSRGFVPIGGDGNIIELKTNRQNMKLGWGLWGVVVMNRWRKRKK
jgi:hypothetical protein